MNMKYIWIAVAVLVVVVGAVWYTKDAEQGSSQQASDFGTYAYECDEHVAFTMTPSSDMRTIAIRATTGAYPPATTLEQKTASSGVRYEGNGIVMTAHGETVTLGEGDSAINCSPVPSADMAPMNFGD